MQRHRNGRSRGVGTFLVLGVLLVSSFADRAGDHEPKSSITESVPRFGGREPASNAVLKISRHERSFAKASLAAAQQDVARRSKDLGAGSPKLIGFEQPLSGLAQRDSAEVEHTWNGGDDHPTWTGGAIESLPSSFDGARFNLTTSLSGAVEVVLPFGEEVAEEVNESEFGNDFRVFGSLTMKF